MPTRSPALLVAALVIGLALRLLWQSVQVLMDRTSADAEGRIRAALAGLREPLELRRVRVRHAAGRHFADLVVGVASDKGVVQAHATADAIEELVRDGARQRRRRRPRRAGRAARAACASARPPPRAAVPEVREVHNVRVMRVGSAYEVSLHVKLPRELSLAEAHDVIERLESAVRAAVPELRSVHTHIEPLVAHRLGVGAAAGRHGVGARRGRGDRARHHRHAARRRCASATPSAAASRSSRSCCRASSRCRRPTTTRAGSRRRCASAARASPT